MASQKERDDFLRKIYCARFPRSKSEDHYSRWLESGQAFSFVVNIATELQRHLEIVEEELERANWHR